MKITVYTKTKCPWVQEVLAFLTLHKLPFEEKDMFKNEAFKRECINKSGQWKCPTLDIDGHILADSDAKQVKEYLKTKAVL